MTGDDPRFDDGSAPAPGPWVATIELDGEAVLFDERSGGLHLLDPVATLVWNRLDGAATLADLATDFSTTFAADRSRVRDDLMTFVCQLDGQHLLEGDAPAAADDDG